ncbi:MAG: hypothetical protein JO287_23490 [Pseudonocardiales bacterium]|nr:hypothetical protein [Pseudonocardiales bacterium]
MVELTCQQCREVAAELALDVLPCHQRADALAHLERCAACQDTVSALTVTADRLVELLPAAEPPAGFEQRVISALAPPAPRARRRWWIAAAAGLVTIALAAGGWILGYLDGNGAPADVDAQADERTVMYAPLTTAQHQIGNAYVYPGTPSWIYLSLDGGTASNTVNCDVVRRDGSAVRVGTFPLAHGHGAWGGPAPVDRKTLATARLTDGRGDTLATARFGSPPHRSAGSGSHSHGDHRHPQHPR